MVKKLALSGFLALILSGFVLSSRLPKGSVLAQVGVSPTGYLDLADGTSIAGWARDDDYSGPIYVHIYVDDVLVHDILADGYRSDVGYHSFHWNHPPFGYGNHKVVVYAIGVDENGQRNGDNPGLINSPRYFDVGCARLVGNEEAWCLYNPGYWLNRQQDTTLLGNSYIKIGINNSYGGTITQLYGDDRTDNLILEHGGGALQLSIYGYDINGGNPAWFGNEQGVCNPTPYSSETACLGENSQCVNRSFGYGAHVADCVNVGVCAYWSAGAPWNPIQAQAANCGWDDLSNDVDYSGRTATGGWEIRLDDPNHFSKRTTGFEGMSFTQVVELGDVYAKVDYEIDYSGQYTTDNHPQELPAIFTTIIPPAHYYYYNGNNPYTDPNNPVNVLDQPLQGEFIGFPNRGSYAHGTPFDLATEGWWGVCDQTETTCLTIASFSQSITEAALHASWSHSYITALGYFGISPGSHQEATIYIFPYKYDKVINGKSVRERIFDLAKLALGDLDGDGDVDGHDIRILLENWGDSPLLPAADLSGDGVVNGLDFGKML